MPTAAFSSPMGSPRTSATVCRLLAVGIFLVSLSAALALDAPPRILDQQVIDYGTHKVTLNLVETPVLKLPPAPVVARPPALVVNEVPAVPVGTLYLACTIYNRQATEVRWSREDGEYVIWSGVDFNLLRGLSDFEVAGKWYTVSLGIGDADQDGSGEAAMPWPAPAPGTFKIISSPEKGADPEAIRAIESLHQYFAANRDQLAREYQEGEAARIAKEKWDLEHPPVPQDITVNYFPIRSSYLDGGKAK